jgi:LPS sulfotransferase NodH
MVSTTDRPDALALIGPEYDRPSAQPADRTLIICSAPRTGSWELCRYLRAAGIGVPHEYFNANYARRLGERWAFSQSPLEASQLDRYVMALRHRRAQGGVFATKLQFQHFDRCLRNETGRRLFEGATVVHLFRPDPVAQYASYRSAIETGVWDFSSRPTLSPLVSDPKDFDNFLKQVLRQLDALMGQDAGFRCMFALLGIRPFFVTTDELFRNPRHVLRDIASIMGLSVNESALDHALAVSAPYSRDIKKTTTELSEHFKQIVFGGA